jgi:formate hydrogenlyase subunit 5
MPPVHTTSTNLGQELSRHFGDRLTISATTGESELHAACRPENLVEVCSYLYNKLGCHFATMIVEESPPVRYVFYREGMVVQIMTMLESDRTLPSVALALHAIDWNEREAEDLWGIHFRGHPRLGEFVLHEEWPEGVNPMRASFDGRNPYPHRQGNARWEPSFIVQAEGSFLMPIGPIFSDFAESAHFLLETVGEDVLHTIPRFFYKYRGVEKIAEQRSANDVLLLAERFAGTSAFAHSLAYCQAIERLCSVHIPQRAEELRVLLAELERIRHHVAAIAGICSSTGLAVAASQYGILEEELLRLTGKHTGHRYFFGMNVIGGLARDISSEGLKDISDTISKTIVQLRKLYDMLRVSGSFLDRIEEVGLVTKEQAGGLGLVGPIARASGIPMDLRNILPYGGYGRSTPFPVPRESEGDGFARLRVLMHEIEISASIVEQKARQMREGPFRELEIQYVTGAALGWSEAPLGAAFHWVRIDDGGKVLRYRIAPPSFANWLGFHAAAENFAFQDFPIIMATFGLSNAESDR